MPVKILQESLLEKIAAAAQKIYNQPPDGLEIGFPPTTDLGHFAVGCFPLAKQYRKSPAGNWPKIWPPMMFCKKPLQPVPISI